MKAAVKYMCSLVLFASFNCDTQRNNPLILRQIMREDDGTVCKRVYLIPEEPGKEFVEIYFSDGRISEQYYRKDGKLDGFRFTYYTNGQLSETGNWQHDRRTGLFVYYRTDGRVDCTRNFGLLEETETIKE